MQAIDFITTVILPLVAGSMAAAFRQRRAEVFWAAAVAFVTVLTSYALAVEQAPFEVYPFVVVGSIMLWLPTFVAFAVCRIPDVRRYWVVSFVFTAVAYSFVQWGALYLAAYSGAVR